MAWGYISLEMHRAHLAGIRAGMFVHARAAFDAAWPHIREWQVQAVPLCFVVALGVVTFRRRTVEELRERDEVAPTAHAAAVNGVLGARPASASSPGPRPSSRLASTSKAGTCCPPTAVAF